MIAIDIDVYSAFAVIFNTLCLEVAYDSMRLFHWYLHYIYDLILYLCIVCYTVCYLTGIFYAVIRQISMLFIDNKISVFCILTSFLQGCSECVVDIHLRKLLWVYCPGHAGVKGNKCPSRVTGGQSNLHKWLASRKI